MEEENLPSEFKEWDECDEDDTDPFEYYCLDPAFRSWDDANAMFYRR